MKLELDFLKAAVDISQNAHLSNCPKMPAGHLADLKPQEFVDKDSRQKLHIYSVARYISSASGLYGKNYGEKNAFH